MSALTHDRRAFLGICSAAGLGSTLFPGVLWAMTRSQASLPIAAENGSPPDATPAPITREMIDNAAAVAGISISDKDKDMMLRDLNDQVASYQAIRALALKNSDQMTLVLNPVGIGDPKPAQTRPRRLSRVPAAGV